ncbi:MAG: Na+ dependent nucleoside transporter [Bacteroidia bacterium]|nr:Na+ dependent nucleoside transporter [Bacteroidia bacterium]
MVLNATDNSFSYNLEKLDVQSSGNWTVQDSNVLVFAYNPNLGSYGVDSVVMQQEGNQTTLDYLNEGELLGTLNENGFQTNKNERRFEITALSDNELSIEENGVHFNYRYEPDVPVSSINMNSIGRGILGMFVLLLLCWLMSSNRRAINWKLVFTGLGLQLGFALGVLKVPFINSMFEVAGNFFVSILNFTQEGALFVFGDLAINSDSIGFIFAFQILPTIVFFSALTSVLFYFGIIQKVVWLLAWVMKKTMGLSGAESLSAAGNIFLGQTEAPLLIKPYIDNMTKSELLTLMGGGMATIAGGVMAAYIGFLGGDDPVRQLFYAKHLLAASVMSAPAAVVAAKMLLPQTEKVNEEMQISEEKIGHNVLEAISNGTTDGIKLAVNVGAMLLVFLALVAMVNYALSDIIGNYTGLNDKIASLTGGRYNEFTLQLILGYVGAPLSWLMGVCKEDIYLVGQLLGEKVILNEFVAYVSLGELKSAGMFAEEKSIIIATYILCGFANIPSIGIQIGGIGAIAPKSRTTLSELGVKALIVGTFASFFTAVLVGMLI